MLGAKIIAFVVGAIAWYWTSGVRDPYPYMLGYVAVIGGYEIVQLGILATTRSLGKIIAEEAAKENK